VRNNDSNLDFLRACAVLCVAGSHLMDVQLGEHTSFSWHLGQMGVLAFFVHTSLVLMRSLERMRPTAHGMVTSFYIRRFFRIYPLSMLCVLAIYWLHLPPHPLSAVRPWTGVELISSLGLIQNLTYAAPLASVLWSLPIEVDMYVLLPFFYLLLRRRSPWAALACWAASVPAALAQPQVSGRLDVIGYAPCFLAGISAWRLSARYRPRLAAAWWPVTMLAVSPLWMASSRQDNMFYRWAFCLALGLAIPCFKEIASKPVNTASKLIARYSYGIYLTHCSAMWIAFRACARVPALLQWMLFAILAAGAPVLLYHAVENPMIRVGSSLTAIRWRRLLTFVSSAAFHSSATRKADASNELT
jgi:peptidoglycan/LPS O-acetylase OafA/YrhL